MLNLRKTTLDMGYSNYKKLHQLTKKFNLQARTETLFGYVEPIQASEWLLQSLEYAYIVPPTNEKAKSERLVSPILIEIQKSFPETVSIFSGEEININPQEDLSGPCDFIFALSPPSPFLESPIISLAEAKDEDLEWGIAQCSAQLYAAHLFNLQEGKDIPVLYGCATDGVEWQFLKFENNVFYIDRKPITVLSQILGIWHQIIHFYLKNQETA